MPNPTDSAPSYTLCEYCNRRQRVPCRNTRDMEETAEAGDRECFWELAKLGGGEKGLMYVIAHAKRRNR